MMDPRKAKKLLIQNNATAYKSLIDALFLAYLQN